MQEQLISFKYDGQSRSIKNHQIDIRLLAGVLDNLADLITTADAVVNKRESNVKIMAKAGFVQGSFGVELIVNADPATLEAIGFATAAVAGSALSILKNLKGRKVDNIEIDEDSDIAKILTADGEELETSKESAKLIDNKDIRTKLDKLVYQPLTGEDIDSFSVYSGAIPSEEEAEAHQPVFEATTENSAYYKRPSRAQTHTKEVYETTATIEFIIANKHSGTSGWRMNHLGENESVKIRDEAFLSKIQTENSPRFFAGKFSVELETSVTLKYGEVVSKSFSITKVNGPKND